MQSEQLDSAIISDTSCLISLAKINKLDILRKLYKEIIITPEVASEYRTSLPDWIVKKEVKDKSLIIAIQKDGLGIGESSAIALAMETENSLLILDEIHARKYALSKGLIITGIITIIAKAYDKGYIESYEAIYDELREANFRFTQKIQDEAIKNIVTDKKMNKNDSHSNSHKKGFRR